MHLIQSSFLHGETGNSIERKLCESPGGPRGGRDRYVGNRLTLYSFRESLCKTNRENSCGNFLGFLFRKPMRKPLRNSPAEKYNNSLVNFS